MNKRVKWAFNFRPMPASPHDFPSVVNTSERPRKSRTMRDGSIATYLGMTCSCNRSCSGSWSTGSLSDVTRMWTLVSLLPHGIRCYLFRVFLCIADHFTSNPQSILGCLKSQHHSPYILLRHADPVITRRGEPSKHFHEVLICEIAQPSIAHSALEGLR